MSNKQMVILQVEGISAQRIAAEFIPAHVAFFQADHKGHDIYLVDGCGRTWAPLPGGEWLLWN